MQTCENCGASFEPNDSVVEVTSLRILCPKCLAERQAAKARKALQASAPSHAARTEAPAPRAPGAASAPRAAPAPAAGRPVASKPADRQSSAAPAARPRPTESARSEASSKAAAPASPPPPVPARKAVKGSSKKKQRVETHSSEEIQKKSSREVLVAFLIAFVILGVAGGALYKAYLKKTSEETADRKHKEEIETFRATFMAMDMTTEEGATALVAFGAENKPKWEVEEFAGEVVSRTAKAKNFLEAAEERRKVVQRMEAVEAVLARAAELQPSELAEPRRQLEEIAARAELVGPEFVQRVAAAQQQADSVYLERLLSSANAAAATEPLDRAALTTIQQAEDEVLKIFEAAYRAWDVNKQEATLREKKERYEKLYTGLIKLSDESVERFFTPEVVAAVPWTDLLATDQEANWVGATVQGFEHRIVNGVLHMVGPAPEVGGEGIISIGDREQWRDFALDIEFTLVKGECSIHLRLPRTFQENVQNINLTTDDGYYEAGVSHKFTVSLIGSTQLEEDVSEESIGPSKVKVPWTQVRKGAIGISLPKNSEVKFTRFRIKILR
jgi:hypothetical protein